MTLFERIHCWAMARVQAVNAHLAGQRGDTMAMVEYESDSRRYQSRIDRADAIRRFV